MNDTMDPAALLETLIRAMVDHPDSVSVRTVSGDEKMVLELTVHTKDRGQVIGLSGINAQSIRTVLNAVGGKARKRIELKIK